MKIFGDYHTHTVYSHGEGTVADNVEQARAVGLKDIAITDHGLNHLILGLRWWKVEKIILEVKKLREQYSDIGILVGIEANIIGTRGRIDIKKEQFQYFDIILCGFHRPARPDRLRDYAGMYLRSYLPMNWQGKAAIERNTRAYVNAVKNNPIDVLTHINKCIKVNCGEIASVCAEYGTYIELSLRHNSLSEQDYKDMLNTGVKFIMNSDAHKIKNVGDVGDINSLLTRYNIPLDRVVNIGNARPAFRSRIRG